VFDRLFSKRKSKSGTNTPRASCSSCGSVDSEVLHRHDFAKIDNYPIRGYGVSLCSECGLVFANDIPSQADLDKYYLNSNKYDNEELYGPYDAQYQVANWILKNINRFI
jgi:transcription elongation factor Elf1